jgi:hypothetical protein
VPGLPAWNDFELLVEGERLRVHLNGVLINDFTNTNPTRSLAGHIGIQNHGTDDDVSFRNIRVKELDPTADRTVEAESVNSASGVQPFTKLGGPVLGSVAVPNTGGWSAFSEVQTTLTSVPTGPGNLYLTFTGREVCRRGGPARRTARRRSCGPAAVRTRRAGPSPINR